MSFVLPSNDEEKIFLLEWLSERLPVNIETSASPIGIARENHLVAVIALHGISDGLGQISLAADNPRWATKEVIRFTLSTAFEGLNLRRLTALTAKSNKRVHKLLEGVGFAKEGFHRQLFPKEDGISWGMTRRYYKRSKWNGCARRR
ncbi:MAG: GNAT family N-acetyltransferase [Gammaproteobacteria bacterium]